MDGKREGTTALSMREFALALQYECARADREESEFSLVAFRLAEGASGQKQSQKLIQAMTTHHRGVDSVGWIDRRHLGVLLPSTGPEGCARFVADVGKRKPSVDLPHAIFHYSEGCPYLSSRNEGSAKGSSSVLGGWDDGDPAHLDAEGVAALEDRLKQVLVRSIPVWKRLLDLVGASVASILFAPLALPLSAYIKIVSPGPVLFRQQRVGYKGEPFTFLKFRTMHVRNDDSEHSSHLKGLIRSEKPMEKLDETGDPRIIPGGRMIRKACLDELPQLINVLKGEMSLVGPRPCLPYEAEEFRRWHAYRFDVLPGITGLWQVSGKNKLTFRQMIRLDICYCRRMSLWLDLKVLLLTAPAIFGMIADAVVRRCRPSTEAPTERPTPSRGTNR